MQNRFTISYSHWEIIRPLIQYAGVLVLLYEFVFRFRDSNVLFFGMVSTVILVICRDLITILQNQSLVRHLKIFNQQLERKIGERTKELTDSHRELEDAFKQIDYIARHDTFSSLPNRRYLEQMIGWKIQESKQNRTMVALIFIDVDRLKHINDTVGHALGDAVLLSMIERMKENLPEGVFLARHGGDEFAVIIDGIYFEDEATRYTENLLHTVAHPFHISDKELTITLSIGVALYPDNSDSVEELMKHADLAMYKAKEERQNKIVVYSKEMDHEVVGRMEMLSDLQAAIKRKEFIVYYQPQFDIHSGNLSGVEALVRWQHPLRGFISPGEFIPLAEEFNLIVPIDDFVLDSAMKQFMEWQKHNISPPRLSVNLCSQQFLKGDISEKLKDLLIKHQFPADHLVIEMTESVAMHDESFLTKQLHEISGMGIQISIDDFGTGYSSLSYVKNYPLDQLKIARPFIMDVPKSHSDIAMVKAIIDLSHHFNLNVVVEGVETYDQLQFLRSVHCEEVQGFYFSKPLSPVDMEEQYLLPVKEGTSNH
jgi:diguanylate cyclase (GGDEF)-like protein